MSLSPDGAVDFLKRLEFNRYAAKSSGESLLIHSLSVYSLVNNILPYTEIYSPEQAEIMRWAALLHDYGKTGHRWQKAKSGPHRPDETSYEKLRDAINGGIQRYSPEITNPNAVDDILFIIEFHHASGLGRSTPERNQMKDVVSQCDSAVSQGQISDDLIRALNTLINTARYRLFTIGLIDHPISPLVIGAFDYVLHETGSFTPLLYSTTSTLFIGPVGADLPSIAEVNDFLNMQLAEDRGVLNYRNTNARIYSDERSFINLASNPDKFLEQARKYVDAFCARQRKAAERDPSRWSDEAEEEYLYGRVCGGTYNTLLQLCDVPDSEHRPACLKAGAQYGRITAEDMRLLGIREQGHTYEHTLKKALETLKPHIERKARSLATGDAAGSTPHEAGRYNVRDLFVPNTTAYPSEPRADPKRDAAADYERYMRKNPADICPVCSQFPQGNVSASAFPSGSPLGGTVEVFYTTHMRLIKKDLPGNRGVSPCSWCFKWWELISTDEDNTRHLYRLCVMPRHLFGRLDWREILAPRQGSALVELGDTGTLTSGVYPHIAVLSLRGKDREALLQQLVADPERADVQILDRLYEYGLSGATITTSPAPSRRLLTCGSTAIHAEKWQTIRTPLRLLNHHKCTYAAAARALQQSPYAFGTLLAKRSIIGTEQEIRSMVMQLAEDTGLSFLRDIWIGGKPQNKVENAGKVIRGMNETLRRLKDSEDAATLLDSMTAKGLHLALSTREGKQRKTENREKENAALRKAASKIIEYKTRTYKRTELVRAMIYTLAYFSNPETEPDASAAIQGDSK